MISTRVVAAVIHEHGRVLAARRAKGQKLAGHWEFPGGKVEPGESPEQSLIRELAEELSVDIRVERFLLETEHSSVDATISIRAYLASIAGGALRPTVHDSVDWFLPVELRRCRLAPADRPIVDFLVRLTTDSDETGRKTRQQCL